MQYVLRIYPEVYIDYYITADDEAEAWKKYHAGDWDDEQEEFTAKDWAEPELSLAEDGSNPIEY